MDQQIEAVRDFWDSRPCNIRHSLKPIGSKEYFDEVEAKKYRAEPHILSFASFDQWNGKDVLEIGCGMGTAAVSFARAGAHLTAVDLSDISVNLCKERLKVFNLEADVFTANAEELDKTLSPDKKYDLIYSFGVIHHTPTPKNIISQARKFIKPNGQLRIMLYSLISYKVFQVMHETDNWNIPNMRKIIEKYSEAQMGSPCTYVYSFDEIEQLLHPYFKVTKIWKNHIFTWDIEEYKKGNFVRAKAFHGISDDELKKLESELGWHTMVIAEPI